MKDQQKKATSGTPLTSVFYTELVFIAVSLVLCGYGILLPSVSILLWLPCLLLLCSTCISLSTLIYLNKGVVMKSKRDLLMYVLFTLILVIIRVLCCCLLVVGIFAAHADPRISGAVTTVTLLHALYGLYAIAKATVIRMGLDKRTTMKDSRVEEIAIINLKNCPRMASQATLVTNLDEADLVTFP